MLFHPLVQKDAKPFLSTVIRFLKIGVESENGATHWVCSPSSLEVHKREWEVTEEERCVGTQQMELRGAVKSCSKNKLAYQFLS